MKKIIICLLILMISLTGCIEPKIDKCNKPSSLSCEEVSDCMSECDDEPMITWAMDCRSKFSPYVIAKCGTNT